DRTVVALPVTGQGDAATGRASAESPRSPAGNEPDPQPGSQPSGGPDDPDPPGPGPGPGPGPEPPGPGPGEPPADNPPPEEAPRLLDACLLETACLGVVNPLQVEAPVPLGRLETPLLDVGVAP
ncbi:MAG: hypothetical protein ACRDYU_00405, partial [Actinomycetes bacterium]